MQAGATRIEQISFKAPNLLSMRFRKAFQIILPSRRQLQTPTARAVATVNGAPMRLEGLDQLRGRMVLSIDRIEPDQVPTFVRATMGVAEPASEGVGHIVDQRVV